VVLYGFGRIGRLLARELMSKTGKGSQRLRAIVTRDKDATTLERGLRFCVMTQFMVILVP
jgi:glyceraldehyde 3-phosphate dehydrogenase